MGYGTYLKELLRPLGLYELDTGPGSAELEAMGTGMDAVFDRLTEIERESVVSTAQGEGLERYAALLPYAPVAGTPEQRRAAIMALLRIDDAGFTPAAIRDTISGCGITADVQESDTPQTVVVSFPGVMGEPAGFAAIQSRVEQILPCHLDIVYALRYLTWTELQGWGLTWQKIEQARLTWKQLECYCEEG